MITFEFDPLNILAITDICIKGLHPNNSVPIRASHNEWVGSHCWHHFVKNVPLSQLRRAQIIFIENYVCIIKRAFKCFHIDMNAWPEANRTHVL